MTLPFEIPPTPSAPERSMTPIIRIETSKKNLVQRSWYAHFKALDEERILSMGHDALLSMLFKIFMKKKMTSRTISFFVCN